jgi:glycine/serine hydroxymethyltransferase
VVNAKSAGGNSGQPRASASSLVETDTHLMLVDVVFQRHVGSRDSARKALGEAANHRQQRTPFHLIPNPPLGSQAAFASGSPALTTRGMKENEMRPGWENRWIAESPGLTGNDAAAACGESP